MSNLLLLMLLCSVVSGTLVLPKYIQCVPRRPESSEVYLWKNAKVLDIQIANLEHGWAQHSCGVCGVMVTIFPHRKLMGTFKIESLPIDFYKKHVILSFYR